MTDKTMDFLKTGVICASKVALTITADEAREILTALSDSAENKPEHEKLINEIEANREKEVVIVPAEDDLISRQAVLDELEKWDWQDLYLPIHFKQILDDIPSVENKGFEGITKGEVFMSLFPNAVDEEQAKWFFGLEWWNAPYQKGGKT